VGETYGFVDAAVKVREFFKDMPIQLFFFSPDLELERVQCGERFADWSSSFFNRGF
jgi:hypothetical protein